MRQYIQPCTDVISVHLTTTLLTGSDRTTPIVGGEEQVNAW